ncbi:MAG: CHAT domain-containing protein [Cyclobacteriaceae bacterium]|nr:CHAT domain-containing protein [Cyclobacteriaceae bacterium]
MKLTLASTTTQAIVCVLWLCCFLWSCDPQHKNRSPAAIQTGKSYWNDPRLVQADSFQWSQSLDTASIYYQQAADYFLQEENWELLTHCYNMITFNLLAQGQLTEAGKRLGNTRNIVEEHLDPLHPSRAEYLFNEGLFLANSNLIDSALQQYQRAVEIFEAQDSEDILIMKAHNYHRLGDLYRYSLDNLPQAEEYYLKALGIREKVYSNTHFDLMVSYYALSSLSRVIDDFKRAELFGVNALRIAENLGGNYWPNQSYCYNLLANIKHDQATLSKQQQHFQESLGYYRKAIGLLESRGGSINDISVYYNNLGAVFKNMEGYDSANHYLHKALNLKQRAGAQDISDSFLNLGWNHTALGNLDSAKYYYDKCLMMRFKNPANQVNQIAEVYNDIGDMYETFDSLDQSLEYSTKTLRLLIPNFKDPVNYQFSATDAIPNSEFTFPAIVNTAKVLVRRYERDHQLSDLRQALQLYQFADYLNDKYRSSRIHDESKLYLTNYYQADFERAIDASYILHNQTKDVNYLNQAFKFIEKDKYVLLFEALIKARLQNKIGVPDSIMDMENQLMTSMAEYQQELDQSADDPQTVEALNIKILEANRQIERLKEQMGRHFPQYYQIQYDSISRNLSSIQSSLESAGTMLLEYYWGDSAIYALGVAKDTVVFTKIPNTPELNQNLQQYRTALSPQNGLQEKIDYFEQYISSAHYLYDALLAPTLVSDTIDRLIIVPDGPLAVIPIESLITARRPLEKVDYSALEYLIKKYQIQYAYSSNLLFQNVSVTTEKPSVLALSHASLIGSSKEVETIADLMKAKTFEGEKATEENFKQYAPDYNILHLAVHGEGDSESILNSKLIFNSTDSLSEDGVLNVYELYGMELNADLAVLSACETGIGKQLQGEGIYSMARAFTYAGCPSVIMSLWKTDDIQSALIFSGFYQALQQGMNSNQALHQAKLEFLESQDEITAHPTSWAALVSIGQSQWPQTKKTSTPLIALGVLAVVLVLIMGYRSRKRKSQHSSR